MPTLEAMRTEELKKLLGYKRAYAKGDEAAQEEQRRKATELRAGYGIQEDVATASEVERMIIDRMMAESQAQAPFAPTPTRTPTIAPTPTRAPAPTDRTADITRQFEEQKKGLLSELRQRIGRARGGYESIIARTPGQYQPLRGQAELGRVRGLEALRERQAQIGGTRGGIGRSEMLTAETAYQKQLGDINLQQQQTVDEANRQIEQLEAQGQFEEAQLVSQNALQLIQARIAEANRIEAAAESSRRFDVGTRLQEAGLTGMYEGERTMAGERLDIGKEAQDITNQINQLKLSALPEQQKLQLRKLEQQIAAGDIKIEEAQRQVDEMEAPDMTSYDDTVSQVRKLVSEGMDKGDIGMYLSRLKNSGQISGKTYNALWDNLDALTKAGVGAEVDAEPDKNKMEATFARDVAAGIGQKFLDENRDNIISAFGMAQYQKMVDYLAESQF